MDIRLTKEQRKKCLEEISENWKLEAKSENNFRYFFNYDEVSKILSGSKSFIIGRKGTGKTAIFEYISNLDKPDNLVFVEKLSFKNFPFNELYSLTNLKYTPPNQYLTLWKYLMYSFICRMMLKNQTVSEEVRRRLSFSYDTDRIANLPRAISNWTGDNFVIQQSSEISNKLSWIEKVNVLEDIIIKNLDSNSKYYIIFDELDEDYRDIKNVEEFTPYNQLLTSLLKAIQDIKNIFRFKEHNVFPIVFLRDDIYRLIQDADKNKWSDSLLEIEWNVFKIKSMLAHRISRTINENHEILPFNKAWNLIFFNEQVQMGNQGNNYMNNFDYIIRSTHIRPRDFIKYINACAIDTLQFGDPFLIRSKTIKYVDKAFSNYLKDEIIDEIHPILPDILNILQVFSQIRKQSLATTEFINSFNEYVKAGTIKETNGQFVLQTLFNFSVIGNVMRNNNNVFRYLNREARINLSESIVIHRGLFKSLQIL